MVFSHESVKTTSIEIERLDTKNGYLENLGIRTIFLGNGLAGFRGFKLRVKLTATCFPGIF